MTRSFIQLTFSERRDLERMLSEHRSVAHIARELNRSHQTITREIKRNRLMSGGNHSVRPPNDCTKRETCRKVNLCMNECVHWGLNCALCIRCNEVCDDFKYDPCPHTRDRSPFVCNACPAVRSCRRKKFYYRAKPADVRAARIKRESREGITYSEDELQQLDELFSARILKGQSIHSIYADVCERVPCCEKQVYRLIASGLLRAKSIDLPLKVRRRVHKKKPSFKVDKKCFLNRTYADFVAYRGMIQAPEVQMDTVHGPREGSHKVILSLYWRQASFLAAFLLERNRAAHVIEVFTRLRKHLGRDVFKKLFPVILTDRGSEFTAPQRIEGGLTRLFYCDPMRADQKGALEQEHRYIRKVLPKGVSFDHLTQDDLNLLLSHITSYSRPGLGDRCPQEVFEFLYGVSVLKCFGYKRISPKDILLTKKLLPDPLYNPEAPQK